MVLDCFVFYNFFISICQNYIFTETLKIKNHKNSNEPLGQIFQKKNNFCIFLLLSFVYERRTEKIKNLNQS